MWEDALIKTIGQFLAFALVVAVLGVLKWILKKIFPKSEGAKKADKYKVGDKIEAITSNGEKVCGVIEHVGSQSYFVKFEKPISFKGEDFRMTHSLYEEEVDFINNKTFVVKTGSHE